MVCKYDADSVSNEKIVVSLVIPSYKGQEKLPALFDALAKQTVKNFEAIVVIDGVFDDSVQLVARENRFLVKSVVFENNRGRVAALNAGFSSAVGDILVRCDDDLLPEDDYVANWIKAVKPGSAVIGQCKNIYTPSRYAAVYGTVKEDERLASVYAAEEDIWRYWGGNVGVDRDVYDAVGKYDAAYIHYGWEDVDYGYRIYSSGFDLHIDPSVETKHRAAAISTYTRAQRAFQSQAARQIFEAKHGKLLPSPIPNNGIWGVVVRGFAKVFSRQKNVLIFARMVDGIIRIAPDFIAEKLISLAVEVAGVSGYRATEKISRDF